jgi:Predicted metal-binding integral membrane protein (DUF2182)
VVVLIARSLQFTAWKAGHLACCREAPGRGPTLPADTGTAWRHGLRLGLHCSHCCAGLMAILLVIGVMDLHSALGTLRERLFHGHLDFRGREILDMRGERPLVAEGVGHDTVAVAPEHVLRWH